MTRNLPARLTICLLLIAAARAEAQTPLGTAFTYQGRLSDGGTPAAGVYDLQFSLFDAASGGSPVGPTLTRDDVSVTAGFFTVSLDFGAAFAGSKRWLEIGVRPGPSTGAYDILAPRQELTPAPNAVFSASAPWTGIAGKPPGFADDVDDDSGGDITAVTAGTGLSGGGGSGAVSLAVDPILVQSRVTGTCAAGSSIRTVNQDGTVVCQPDTTGADWRLSGNAGTNPGTNFLGTTDNVPLELRVNGQRALRLERVTTTIGGATYAGDNVIGGDGANSLTAGVTQATIAGGGGTIGSIGYPNRVSDFGGTVGGGVGNRAGNNAGALDDAIHATVAGGQSNTASGAFSAIAGGSGNMAIGFHAVIAGGRQNTSNANSSAVLGGFGNTASGDYSAVAAGYGNTASGGYSVLGGGVLNVASGLYSVVTGGLSNTAGGEYSLAAGRQARVRTPGQVGGGDFEGDEGTFVWADSQAADFISSGPNQFLIRAAGGVGINTNTPSSALEVNGAATMAGFRLKTAPTAGHVLTSDAAGIGTWQPVPAAGGVLTGRINSLGTTAGTEFGAATAFTGATATETDVQTLSPDRACTAQVLSVRLTAAPGIGNARDFTVRVDSAPAALACVITDSALACTSFTTAVIPAGSALSMQIVNTGTPAAASAMFGWECR